MTHLAIYGLAAVALAVAIRALLFLYDRFTSRKARFWLDVGALLLLLVVHVLLQQQILSILGTSQASLVVALASLCTGLVALVFLSFRYLVLKTNEQENE